MDNQSIQTLKSLMNEVLDDKFSGFKTELIGTMDVKLEHLENRIDQKLESLENRMDQKLESLESRMDQKLESLESRMDQKLESLESRMDQKLESLENRMVNTMNTKIEKLENRMIDTMDVKIRDSENLLLEEMERTRTILENKIDKIQKNVDNLNQYYQIAKLENDNLRLVIESVQNLTKRVEVLEGKSA